MKSVATLAAGMAHEIKNPLTSIKTFAEYLPEKYDDPEFRDKFKRIVMDEVDRVNNIVKQLLEFSRPADLQLTKASPVSILEETLTLLNKNILESGIVLHRNIEGDRDILVDKHQLKQAFLNILLNSIQAMPGGGTLTIGARVAGSYYEILISDTGYGVAREDLPRLFDPFFTRKEEGTGLGLSIVHGIIKEHGGRIEVKSAAGKGMEFRIYLKL